jgi:hypothetical protein
VATQTASPPERGLRAWWRKFWKKEDPEVRRRRLLRETGRIVEGEVIDVRKEANGGILVGYRYEVAGVSYECCQDLDNTQNPADYWLGKRVSVRYTPRFPANSIVV